MQTIYLDISNKGVVPTVYAKQNDVGRKFAVILTDSGLPYIPVSGSAFSVWYKGASGEGNYTDIGDKSAFSLNGNKVEVEMIVQMLSAHGDGILCLTLNSPNGNQISSWNIPYMCEIVPGSESEKAEEYYTAFSESVEKLKKVTDNLTPEAIGAAPAGYGLGEEVQTVSSIDNLLVPGQYKFYNGGYPLIAGVSETSFCDVEVVGSSSGCIQRITTITGGYRAERIYNGTSWGEWSWWNPPMALNVEYRTTERRNGQPVYTMNKPLIVTGSGTTQIQWHDSNVSPIRRACVFQDRTIPMVSDDYKFLVNVSLIGNIAYVLCNMKMIIESDSPIMMQAWYTK